MLPSSTNMMRVTLNGHPADVPDGATIERLLGDCGLIPARVAVEVNEALVPRKTFGSAGIHPGDRIEIVTLVGGG